MSMLTELKATIAKHGSVARANRFFVDFSGMAAKNYATQEETKDLEYFLQDVNMPSKTLETTDYSPYRNPISYVTGFKYGDFSMTFLAPSDMFIKNIFDRWIEKIIPQESYLLTYRKENCVDFTITQKTEREKDIFQYYSYKIINAYPTKIEAIEYSNEERSDTISISVGFAFESIDYNKNNTTKK